MAYSKHDDPEYAPTMEEAPPSYSSPTVAHLPAATMGIYGYGDLTATNAFSQDELLIDKLRQRGNSLLCISAMIIITLILFPMNIFVIVITLIEFILVLIASSNLRKLTAEDPQLYNRVRSVRQMIQASSVFETIIFFLALLGTFISLVFLFAVFFHASLIFSFWTLNRELFAVENSMNH